MPDSVTSERTEPVDILSQVVDDLVAAGRSDDIADVVLGACLGDQELADALGGSAPPRPGRVPVEADATGIYLKSITVEGFRGVGPSAALRLQPQPGLTLVIGRNGSGKSSFAEAAEIAVTGRSSRWDERSKVWMSGWRNLHHGTSHIHVETVEEGSSPVASITCAWAQNAELEQADTRVRRDGQDQALGDLGWAPALSTFRPFLSYAELGDAVTGRPSDLFDALHSILGLGVVDEARRRLEETRKPLDARSREGKTAGKAMRTALVGVDDDRARAAHEQLSSRTPDWDLLESLATGSADPQDGRVAAWRLVAAARFPSAEEVLRAEERLTASQEDVRAAHGVVNAQALSLAEILERAAEHVEHGSDRLCPVCGQTTLDEAWPESARQRARELRSSAAELEAARVSLARARQDVAGLLSSAAKPDIFRDVDGQLVDFLARWHALDASSAEVESVAQQLLELHSSIEPLIKDARAAAEAELQRHEDRWRPHAVQLAALVSAARTVAVEADVLLLLKAAESWLTEEAGTLRDLRMAPFAEQSMRMWQTLRQESNVDLGSVKLQGRGNRRKVDIKVAVDGQLGAALGVMSQGELHALGLALFLPRATAKESPFRFLVIDDPVQAMDPAKVEGLARVLQSVARTRQVIVFTHDERLPDAVGRLGIEATTWEVVRRPNSVIELRKADDVIARYLKDARDLANADSVPAHLRGPVIAGFLRSAVEAAALERARRRLVDAGTARIELERRVSNAGTTNELVALAIFDDVARGGDVLGRLNSWGRPLADAYRLCREGVHDDDFGGMSRGDLRALITSIETLTGRIARVSP